MAAEQPNQISNIDLVEEVNTDPNTPGATTNGFQDISEERRELVTKEIEKLQDEIITLKQALQRKEKQLNDYRIEIGETRWQRIQNSQAMNKSKQALSDAGQKTSQAFRSISAATASKWHEIKESPKVQSASEKFWNATSAVKAKLFTGSMAVQQSITNTTGSSSLNRFMRCYEKQLRQVQAKMFPDVKQGEVEPPAAEVVQPVIEEQPK